MPKTPAERQREQRARLRLDAQSYDVYKAKDRQRKKSWRQQLPEKDLDFLRLRTRVSMHVLRKRRREALPENEAAGLPIEGPLYKCRASFGKAKNKVKRSLPVSPRKQKLIVKFIAKEYGLIGSEYIPRTTGLRAETIEIVNNHYLKDAISRTMPGKADMVVIHEPGEQKRTETKRHLLMTVAEAYALFKADHPDIEI